MVLWKVVPLEKAPTCRVLEKSSHLHGGILVPNAIGAE